MKKIFFLIIASLTCETEDFKSWEADFIFSHHEFGNFDMKRNLTVVSENDISSTFVIRPLLIFKYSQNSSLIIDDGKIKSQATEVTNNVPGVSPKYFKVIFESNLVSSKELNLEVKIEEDILDQLGSDLQMRLNIKNGIDNFSLLVLDNDKGNIVKREYMVLGDEIVETNFGNFNCIKVAATSKDGGKIIYFISPELDFMIIKSFVELKSGETNSLILKNMPRFSAE